MPGKRFDLYITRGPYQDERARLVQQRNAAPGMVLVEMKSRTPGPQGPRRQQVSFPIKWLGVKRYKNTPRKAC